MLLLFASLQFAESAAMFKPELPSPPDAWMKEFNDHAWVEECPSILDNQHQAFRVHITRAQDQKKVKTTLRVHIGIAPKSTPDAEDLCIDAAFTRWYEDHPLEHAISENEPFELVWSVREL